MALYRFGEFEFDSTTGELRTTGRLGRLRPQPARALGYLLEHHGELVNRRDLQRAIWPDDTFVHFDHGLNSCMKQIRAALGDNRSSPVYIETLVRRGFRFIAPVVVVHPDAAEAPPEIAIVATTPVGSGTLCHVWVGRFDATAEQLVREVIATLGQDWSNAAVRVAEERQEVMLQRGALVHAFGSREATAEALPSRIDIGA